MGTTEGVEVRRSKRRRRTVSAYRDGDRIVVLIPASMTRKQEAEWVETMVARLERSEARRRPSDDDLLRRARRLSDDYLGGLAVPEVVRWVDNQRSRWGSCTPGDRSIRLSARLQTMPAWVVDYVLVHELAHLLEAGHNERFWAWVDRYPRAERAKGYLSGWSAAAQLEPPPGADGSTTTRSTDRPARAPRRSARASRPRARGGRRRGHQRTSVDSALTVGSAPAGATATNRTSRWCTSPRGSQKSTACSSRWTGSRSSRRPAIPDSSVASR